MALQATIPHLTRSGLHRLFQRHDISRLPSIEGDKPKECFKTYPIGYVHIDIAEVRTEDGKLHMFVAIDRVSKFAFAELHERATRRAAADFPRRLIDALPYKIHTVLTDHDRPLELLMGSTGGHGLHRAPFPMCYGPHFTTPGNKCSATAEIRAALEKGELFRAHAFEFACTKAGIDHRLTKPNHL